jgi:hypothetical protein
MMERTFDRLVSFDDRSRNYPIRRTMTPKKRRSYTWKCDIYLDQGSEGACTGFAVSHEAAARPAIVKNITERIAKEVYYRARQLDEWPGENYSGSSVLGAMKAALEKGWYKEYRWAFGEDDLALAIGYYGPAVLGINWYDGMTSPNENGLIKVSGEICGGHAILCNGYSIKTGLYRLHNSWSLDWGINGDGFISKEDMKRLLEEQGEACIPVVRLLG